MSVNIKEQLLKNIGVNRWSWLKNQGCKVVESKYSDINKLDPDYVITTDNDEYISLLALSYTRQDMVSFIYKHRLKDLSSINRARTGELSKSGCNSVCIGFNEKEQKWYGFTHRGFGRFGIGYKVKEGSIVDVEPHRYPFVVKTLEEAKQLAIDIADYLD